MIVLLTISTAVSTWFMYYFVSVFHDPGLSYEHRQQAGKAAQFFVKSTILLSSATIVVLALRSIR